jgi:hypothetical protein
MVRLDDIGGIGMPEGWLEIGKAMHQDPRLVDAIGETRFDDTVIRPEVGLALLFDHYLTHEGSVVREGRKYVHRFDVMYGPPRPAG